MCEGVAKEHFISESVSAATNLILLKNHGIEADHQRLLAACSILKVKISLAHGDGVLFFDRLNILTGGQYDIREVNRSVKPLKNWLQLKAEQKITIGEIRGHLEILDLLSDGQLIEDFNGCGKSWKTFSQKYCPPKPQSVKALAKRCLGTVVKILAELEDDDVRFLEKDIISIYEKYLQVDESKSGGNVEKGKETQADAKQETQLTSQETANMEKKKTKGTSRTGSGRRQITTDKQPEPKTPASTSPATSQSSNLQTPPTSPVETPPNISNENPGAATPSVSTSITPKTPEPRGPSTSPIETESPLTADMELFGLNYLKGNESVKLARNANLDIAKSDK